MLGRGICAGERSGESLDLTEKERATWDLDLPLVIFDDSIGDWVVDRFAGNSTAGSRFYQGPALEVGGLQRPGGCVEAGDGTIYMTVGLSGAEVKKLVKVTPDGMLRLVMEENRAVEGPMEQCQAGEPIWNPREKALYLTGPNCLRRVVEKPDGSRWVEVVAGLPGRPGHRDGPAKEATFQSRYRGVVCNSRGTFFWLEDQGLRRIENGRVSTVPLSFRTLDPPKRFNFIMASGLLSLGENDETVYISDFYATNNFRVLRCDVKTGELTRVCGVHAKKERLYRPKEKQRHGKEADGPALTHVGGKSGMRGRYDPFYNALWVWGADHLRARWLRLDGDGWVRTVFGARRPGTKAQPFGIKELNALGIPGEQFRFYLLGIAGTDSQGGVYIGESGDKSGVWRAYNKKKAGKEPE
ncbi:MAG: hypothetical protein JRJ79_10595 [Deltaproteobacteria bacterium]|nr:hypothetical protein [Deltaproteobacteria bacterium]MBW1795614.1 hypothetical protein [Deltaproteobacteria bacterium]